MNERIKAALKAYFNSRQGQHFSERPVLDEASGEAIPGKVKWVIDGDYDPEEMAECVRLWLQL